MTDIMAAYCMYFLPIISTLSSSRISAKNS